MEALLPKLREYERAVNENGHRRMIQFLAERAAEIIDINFRSAAAGKPIEHDAPLFQASLELGKRQKDIRANGIRDPEVDFEVSLCLWYIPDEGAYVGQVGAEDSGFAYDLLLTSGVAEDFYYTDQVGPEAGISPTQWETRRRVWAEIRRGDYSPGIMFSFRPAERYALDDLTRFFPSYDKRCRDFAESELLSARVQAADVGKRMSADSAYIFCKLLRELRDDIGSDPVTVALYEAEQANARTVLPEDLLPYIRKCAPVVLPSNPTALP
jgi:hypothetical protein